MPMNPPPGWTNFGLLPEPEGRSASFITSTIVNAAILILAIVLGMTARRAIVQHHYEMTELIVPNTPPPAEKVRPPEPPKLPDLPKPPEVKLEAPKINAPKPEPKPSPKEIQMEAKLALPVVKAEKPAIILAPQPKPALTAAMPAQVPQARPSTAPVHLGQVFGVTPNPNASRPATVAAIGNPYGGMTGRAIAPHGVVGSTGIGNGIRFGSNAGVVGKVASAGIPDGAGSATRTTYGKVASAGIPAMKTVAAPKMTQTGPASTDLEVLSKPPVRYTAEAKQLRIQGNVVVNVTFLATGQVLVHGVIRGLGHGLDQEALRVAREIRFRPATRNGRPIDLTTNVVITFQLA